MVGDVTPSVAHLRIRASAPSFFASVSVSEVLGYSVALSIAVGLRRSRRVLLPTTVLNASHSFFVLSQDRLVVCT